MLNLTFIKPNKKTFSESILSPKNPFEALIFNCFFHRLIRAKSSVFQNKAEQNLKLRFWIGFLPWLETPFKFDILLGSSVFKH